MRNLRIIVIALFMIVSVAFVAYFSYDRMMVDHTAPQIVCDGVPLNVSVFATDDELCAGLTAHDDVDGDITDRIVVRKVSQLVGDNIAQISYAVFDSSSNLCTFNRYVYYTDYHKPRFSLTQPLTYNVNSTITLADRLIATDIIDGDITPRIRVDASRLSNSTEGEYEMPVRVTNSSGDISTMELTVLIQNVTTNHPSIHLDDYLIYVDRDTELTEDDLRAYIILVKETTTGKSISADNVNITSFVNSSAPGSYNVYYTYTNSLNFTYTVILTVVVR